MGPHEDLIMTLLGCRHLESLNVVVVDFPYKVVSCGSRLSSVGLQATV